MTKPKMILFVLLALAGTGAMVLYAAVVLPAAPSSFQVAVLVFTGIAAIVGWLGLLVSFLTYRLEAGRVPRPDLAMRIQDGSWGKSLHLAAQFADVDDDFGEAVNSRKAVLDAALKSSRPNALTGGFDMTGYYVNAERYEEESEEHLADYRDFLEAKAYWDSFWMRSFVVVLRISNDKAGVPASGVKIELHFPEETEGLRIVPLSELPDRPEEPHRPSPPQPGHDFLGSVGQRYVMPTPHIDFPTVSPPGNVSGPEIGRGSVLVTYTVAELLHNTVEMTEEDPLVVCFLEPGNWSVPYEIHARNLPEPKKGSLTFEAHLSDDSESYEPSPSSFEREEGAGRTR